jgi:competence CoiA-like predicted nuclease
VRFLLISEHRRSRERIKPVECIRGFDLVCPECKLPVVLKLGKVVCPHFAHAQKSNCSLESESAEHMMLKQQIYNDARKLGIDADMEVTVGENRTDVLLKGKLRRVAVEVQLSAISLDDIWTRMENYRQHNVEVLWVVTPPYDLYNIKREYGTQWKVPKWQHELHDLCNESLFYYAGNFKLTVCHLMGWRYKTYKHHKINPRELDLRHTVLNEANAAVPPDSFRWWESEDDESEDGLSETEELC